MSRPLLPLALLGWAFVIAMAGARDLSAQTPQATSGTAARTLQAALTLPNATTNGVAIAPGGRTFLVIAKQKGQEVPQIAEWVQGQLKPYPDASWNSWKKGDDASRKFVHANSVRFGPDGTLWVVDFGAPELYDPVEKHGGKLVGINITTGQVVETLYLDKVRDLKRSAPDDVRFYGDHAYITDAGWPGVIVVHQPDGAMYRVLNDQPSVTAQKPLYAEGHELQDKHGKPIFFHADQMEVSPDGKTFYYQPCSGPLSAIPTQFLDDPTLPDSERGKHVRLFANNNTAGGTAIDAKGNVYVSDTMHDAVLKVTPEGQITTLVQDPRLVWVDALWITPDGRLWMPAAQMDRTPSFNYDKQALQLPMTVYTVQIGAGPSAIDHR